jgi:hypothetical protein
MGTGQVCQKLTHRLPDPHTVIRGSEYVCHNVQSVHVHDSTAPFQ